VPTYRFYLPLLVSLLEVGPFGRCILKDNRNDRIAGYKISCVQCLLYLLHPSPPHLSSRTMSKGILALEQNKRQCY
jgi:hypothetical protein